MDLPCASNHPTLHDPTRPKTYPNDNKSFHHSLLSFTFVAHFFAELNLFMSFLFFFFLSFFFLRTKERQLSP